MANRKHTTNYFVVLPNVMTGMGSIFNIMGNYYRYNYWKSDEEVDCRAISSDWEVIGQDIHDIIDSNPIDKMKRTIRGKYKLFDESI